MKKLSEQLQDLSDQAKNTEDAVAAARARNRTELQQIRERVHATTSAAVDQAKNDAAATKDVLQTEFAQTRERVENYFADLRARSDRRRTDHDVRRAGRRADEAEREAAEAVEFALYVLDGAINAVVDAALARAEEDEMAAKLT